MCAQLVKFSFGCRGCRGSALRSALGKCRSCSSTLLLLQLLDLTPAVNCAHPATNRRRTGNIQMAYTYCERRTSWWAIWLSKTIAPSGVVSTQHTTCPLPPPNSSQAPVTGRRSLPPSSILGPGESTTNTAGSIGHKRNEVVEHGTEDDDEAEITHRTMHADAASPSIPDANGARRRHCVQTAERDISERPLRDRPSVTSRCAADHTRTDYGRARHIETLLLLLRVILSG